MTPGGGPATQAVMREPSDTPQPAPAPAAAALADREARLAKALRDNLRRRKTADRPPPGQSSDP